MVEPDEPLYMILTNREAGRVLSIASYDRTSVRVMGPDVPMNLVVIGEQAAGSSWTLVTVPQLAHLRLLGEVVKVYDK